MIMNDMQRDMNAWAREPDNWLANLAPALLPSLQDTNTISSQDEAIKRLTSKAADHNEGKKS